MEFRIIKSPTKGTLDILERQAANRRLGTWVRLGLYRAG